MIISIENNLIQPQTLNSYTASNVLSGGSYIPVKNSNGFTNQYAVQIGATGQEQSEIVVIGAPGAGSLPLNSGTLVYNHPIDTPVYQIKYNQIILKRSTAGTAGTASAYATFAVTPDSQYTQYDDTSGLSTYAYKVAYYNSVNSFTSSDSDWFTPSGPSYYSLQKMRQRAKDALYNASYLKSDQVVNDWLNEWKELMENSAIKVNQAYSVGTTNVAFGTAGLGTITVSDFKQPIKFEMTFDGIGYVMSTEIPYNRWSTRDYFTTVFPRHYWLGDTIFGILPQGNAGTARIAYAQMSSPMVNETDELPLHLRSYTVSCIDYILYRAYSNDNKGPQAKEAYDKFLIGKNDFIKEITPRDQTGPKFVDFVEGLSGMNEDLMIGPDWII